MSKSNLKAVSGTKPEPLTYEQMQRLAKGVADSVIDDEWLIGALLIFTRELINQCRDMTHVETAAMVLEDCLYAVTIDCNKAQKRFIEARRTVFLEGGA